MLSSRLARLAFVLVALALAMAAAACDDDDNGGDPTPTVSAPATAANTTVAATQTPQPELPTASPSAPPAARVELFASPLQLVCDGGTGSIVTARVYDANGLAVEDGTPVRFGVVTLGTANPINTATRDGVAESTIVALGSGQGVNVTVTSGEAEASIRIDCL